MSKCHPSIDKQIEGVGGREGMKSQSWDLIEDKLQVDRVMCSSPLRVLAIQEVSHMQIKQINSEK